MLYYTIKLHLKKNFKKDKTYAKEKGINRRTEEGN